MSLPHQPNLHWCRWALAIFLIAASALALELAVMRYMLVAYWQHLYYLVISAALLGFGASGTVISLVRRHTQRRAESACWLWALLFALATAAGFHLLNAIPLNMMHLTWHGGQAGFLLLQYLVLFLPFLFAGCCLGTALTTQIDHVGKLYGANMLGSGLGAAAAVALMYCVPSQWLAVVISWGAFAGMFLLAQNRRQRLVGAAAFIIAQIVLGLIFPPQQAISQYKALSHYRQLPDVQFHAHRQGPLGRIDLITSESLHLLPGRSFVGAAVVPPQSALVIDADGVSSLTRFDDPAELAAFDETTMALPYHLLAAPRTLVIGAAGGFDVGLALYHGCPQITALEINRQIIGLVQGTHADLCGNIYSRPGVTLVAADARGYLRHSPQDFDLVQIPPMDSFAAAAAGVHAVNENYLYTVEAFRLCLQRLTSDGVLCLTRWVRFWPERDGIKLLATAIEALEQAGLKPAADHLIAIRNWATITVLASPTPFNAAQLAALRSFCRQRQFDIVYCPGIIEQEANRYHVLLGPIRDGTEDCPPVYAQAARELLDPLTRPDFYDQHLCYVCPATDDRPYFHDFFRWRSLPTMRRLQGDHWAPFLDWGYLILICALVQSVLVAAVLILLPLKWLPRPAGRSGKKMLVIGYFGGIGLAYMFVEMIFIQRLALVVASPIFTIAVVLTTFLCFSGLGSLLSGRWRQRPMRAVLRALLVLVILGSVYALFWNRFITPIAAWPLWARIVGAGLIPAPLAFLMGMPFPLGMSYLRRHESSLAPWAWAVNGFASVIAASLAVCLSIAWGQTLVLCLGLGLYLAVAAIARCRR